MNTKNFMVAIIAIFANVMVANAQSTTASDSIKALKAENAKLRSDLQSVTAVGQANSKGCGSLHVDTLRRVIKGFEPCNGFYGFIGGGYNHTTWKVAEEGTSGSTGAPVATVGFGYRHGWFRPELSVTAGAKQTIEDREYTMTKVKAVVNIDVLRFHKVHKHHSIVDPYLFAGISYNVISSKKVTGVGDIPYDGNQFRGEAGIGAWFKLGTFGCGRTTVNAGGKSVSLKKLSQLFLDINLSASYGELAKPRLAGESQPKMTNFDITPTARLVWKF